MRRAQAVRRTHRRVQGVWDLSKEDQGKWKKKRKALDFLNRIVIEAAGNVSGFTAHTNEEKGRREQNHQNPRTPPQKPQRTITLKSDSNPSGGKNRAFNREIATSSEGVKTS